MITIYLLKNTLNNKVYVGQTCKNLSRRFKNGLGYQGSCYINKAIKKYGKYNFYYDVITFCATQECADLLEKFFINKYNSTNPKVGYNICIGGRGVMSGRKHTSQTIQKMKKSKIGKNTWMKGRKNHHSEQHKIFLSKQMKLNELWKMAPSNIKHILKYIEEKHTKVKKSEYESIINRVRSGEKIKDIAVLYNVHVTVIQKITRGIKRQRSLISEIEHINIFKDYENGITCLNIAMQYKVSVDVIRRIVRKMKK